MENGKIPISDAAWYTPLYHIVLDMFIVFTGITDIGQLLVLTKAVTALVDLLLVLTVYLVTTKFFSKKSGALAAALLLLCFPLYEINAWGGYTTILALSFMMLTFLHLASPAKGIGYTLTAFIFAFSVVLSHQLATFLAVFILPPFIIAVLTKYKGHYSKALIAALLGGGIAFGIYYLIPILPYLGELIYIIFFQLTLYRYQIPLVSGQEFIVNFGFLLFLAFTGLIVGFFTLRKKKALSAYLLLSLSFLVPLFFSQAYMVGIHLPYHRFIYYLMPALAIFAGVATSFLIDTAYTTYFNYQKRWRHNFLKILAIVLVCTLIVVVAVRFDTVSEKIGESIVFYSTSEESAYRAGVWLKEKYPDSATKVVVMQQPGQWFGIFADKTVIAQTDPIVEWMVNAESVLDLSYEMQHPLTMVRVYETKGNFTEWYISANMVWTRLVYLDSATTLISFRTQQDTLHTYELSSLNRTVTVDDSAYPKSVSTQFSGEGFTLTQVISASNSSYPLTITWHLSALQEDLTDVKLYLNYYFDSTFSFTKAYIPSLLNWESPWNNPTKSEPGWVVTSFIGEKLDTGDYISVYTESDQAAFGVKFVDSPAFGNIGALSSGNIDAIRFEYQFSRVEAYTTETKAYQLLSFSQSSTPQIENLAEMNTLFDHKIADSFNVDSRDFTTIARENNIGFTVYDTQRFDESLLNSKWLEVIYANNKYILCKISLNQP